MEDDILKDDELEADLPHDDDELLDVDGKKKKIIGDEEEVESIDELVDEELEEEEPFDDVNLV